MALSNEELRLILDRARVPEHSARFMAVVSGGEPFLLDGFLFFRGEDWLTGIGYPLDARGPDCETGPGSQALFERALQKALRDKTIRNCWTVAPFLPGHPQASIIESDVFYLLAADAPVPPRLRGPVAKAAASLTVTEERIFGPGHRRLWAEFLGRAAMRPNVRELYARTEAALAASRASFEGSAPPLDLRLLSAVDAGGNPAASLLLDYSPASFCSYIIGAHSQKQYVPHATDLLFASLLERARAEGKHRIHLGLGVNEGIARFKRKWGGRPSMPCVMASLSLSDRPGRDPDDSVGRAVRSLLLAPPGPSKQQIFDSLPQQRNFAMLYRVSKGAAVSWLCGSAHFFRYSFEFSFRDLFAPLHTVVFEGPLDEDFLKAVEQCGRAPETGAPRILDAMTEDDLRCLERTVYGPQGPVARLLGLARPPQFSVRELLARARPWFAFFSLWVAYLERSGWHESVDLEAWRTAKAMGKAVIAMENLEEQLDSLESVPIDRIVDFFRRCEEWPAYLKRNVRAYLSADLRGMMGSSIEFPSRTERVIDRRDERFRQRMRPFLEAGDCAVFVGTAHLVGLVPMLREDGFTVTRHRPAWRHRLGAWLAGENPSDA